MYLNAVNYLDIRQSVFTKVLGLYSVFVHAVGYGKQQEDISAILPAASKRELRRQLRLLLPAYKPADRRRCTIRPNRGAVMKFMTEPLWACILPPAAGWLLTWLFPSWQELIWFVVLMGEIPAVWFFIIRFMDYLTSGLHYDSGQRYVHAAVFQRLLPSHSSDSQGKDRAAGAAPEHSSKAGRPV